MEALLRVVKKNPLQKSKTTKHQKLGEGWGENENRDTVREGVTFYVKYLGSTLVEELLEEGQSYGEGISANAVKAIVTMAKAAGKKLPKTSIAISNTGIRVMNLVNQQVQAEFPIHRISFCTADRTYDKVFAYMARNRINETMECHAFLCSKRKVAQAVTLTVAQAFTVAQEIENEFEEKKKKEMENQEKKTQGSVTMVTVNADMGTNYTWSPDQENSQSECSVDSSRNGSLLDQWSDNNESPARDIFGNVPFGSTTVTTTSPSGAKQANSQSFSTNSAKMGFEDNFSDSFSSFAESRSSHSPAARVPLRFTTGLRAEEVDEGVLQLMQGHTGAADAFGRQPSIEDLLSL